MKSPASPSLLGVLRMINYLVFVKATSFYWQSRWLPRIYLFDAGLNWPFPSLLYSCALRAMVVMEQWGWQNMGILLAASVMALLLHWAINSFLMPSQGRAGLRAQSWRKVQNEASCWGWRLSSEWHSCRGFKCANLGWNCPGGLLNSTFSFSEH